MFARHVDLMAMWQNELARYILALFNKSEVDFTAADAHNLGLAAKVWSERFGRYPTIGEIDLFANSH